MMESILIKENSVNTIIYLDNEQYYGYKYAENTIENIDYHSLNIFHSFHLGKKYTKLPNYGQYEVYLDKETGLKHYFYHHLESIHLLFQNNGTYAINYLGNNNKLTDTKIFTLKNKIIICTCLGLMLALSHLDKPEITITNSINLLIDDYELADIEKMINLSSNLTEEEKSYLYNEQFITDALSIVNDFYYEKQRWVECFNNINIVGYHDIEHSNVAGYYLKRETPNTLYVKNYHGFNEDKKGTIAHEYAHLCQDTNGYSLIIEASADIITKEYFYQEYRYGYYRQVTLLKKMMEIIGSYPIWYYNFTGDFSKIANSISPYLTREEYKRFLNDLSFDHEEKELNEQKFQELNELLNTLYYRIYDADIKDNKIIAMIERNDENLVRYYFNTSMLNQENSYHIDFDPTIYETISIEEAIDREVISAYIILQNKITKEDALNIIENTQYMLGRNINYRTHNINISYSRHEAAKTTISGTIDGIKYEQINLDDLVKMGLIDVNYYTIDRLDLNSDTYKKYCDKYKVYFTPKKHTIINKDSVDVIIPQKTYLPPVNAKYENSYTKKKKIT